MLNTKIIVDKESDIDLEISLLEKEASSLVGQDWNRAIECLRRVKMLRSKQTFIPSFKSYLKLPSYLYKANLVDEAFIEFEELIKRVQNYELIFVQRLTYHSDDLYQSIIKYHMQIQLAQIYEAMHKMYKKEKNIDKAIEYKDKFEKYYDNSERLMAENEKLEEKLYTNHRKAVELERAKKDKVDL